MAETYKTAAGKGFDFLWSYYNTTNFEGNIWFGGNTFHTCLDYLINAGVTDSNAAVVSTGYSVFNCLYSPTDWWRDDYGWWGDSFVTAIEHRNALGLSDGKYDPLFDKILKATLYCWQRMNNVWSNELYGVPSDHAAGSANIRGGVYNIPGLTCDPGQALQGRNSVSNEGYFLLSLGLARLFPNSVYGQAADDMRTWVQQFLARTPANNPTKQVGILDADGHVLERPMGNTFLPSWYWSGDQGLLSRALVESNTQPARATQIVNTAIASLKDTSGVLHENLAFVNAGMSGFLGDYATGKGIFMRSLHAVDTNGALKDFILTNAKAVWCNRGQQGTDPNQFTFNWDLNMKPGYEQVLLDSKGYPLDNIIMQAAGLDALNAAMLVVPPDTPLNCS
jgi:hypothetical protein